MLRPSAGMLLAAVVLSLSACKGDPSSAEYWDKALSSAKKSKERVRVVADLRESKKLNPSFLPMLQKHFQEDKQAEVKSSIARVLGEMKDPSSVQPLIDGIDLGSTDSAANGMNKEITSALAAIGDPRANPTLMRLLKARDNYTKIEAINALGSGHAKEAVGPLMEIAGDEAGEPFISKKAIQALGEIGDPLAVPILVKTMFKERRGVSFYVESSFALFQIGKPAADALLPALKGEDKELGVWAKANNVIEPALWAKSAQVLGDLHDARAEKALLQRLGYESDFLDVKLFVRMRMADALGNLRSKEAVKPLVAMLGEEEASARQEYARALARIGNHEAVPALLKAGSSGSWDAREPSIAAAAMLATEADLPAFEKLSKDEEGLTTAECKDNENYAGCKAPAELTKKHVASLAALQKRVEAAKECKTDGACWAKKLDDADAGVRERAAYELGRSNQAERLQPLLSHLTEPNLDARQAIIHATYWLIDDNQQAAAKAKEASVVLDKQLGEEKNKTEFVKVNEDLRRLAVKLKRM